MQQGLSYGCVLVHLVPEQQGACMGLLLLVLQTRPSNEGHSRLDAWSKKESAPLVAFCKVLDHFISCSFLLSSVFLFAC